MKSEIRKSPKKYFFFFFLLHVVWRCLTWSLNQGLMPNKPIQRILSNPYTYELFTIYTKSILAPSGQSDCQKNLVGIYIRKGEVRHAVCRIVVSYS